MDPSIFAHRCFHLALCSGVYVRLVRGPGGHGEAVPQGLMHAHTCAHQQVGAESSQSRSYLTTLMLCHMLGHVEASSYMHGSSLILVPDVLDCKVGKEEEGNNMCLDLLPILLIIFRWVHLAQLQLNYHLHQHHPPAPCCRCVSCSMVGA